MKLTPTLAEQGFSLHAVVSDDLGRYIDVKRDCYRKYVVEYYGGWVEDDQVERNTQAFGQMMEHTCFQKILLDDDIVGFLAYDIQEDKIEGLSIQMVAAARNRGIGSLYLRHITALADGMNRPAYLKVFLSNPARRLYRRWGFEPYGQTASHELMVYQPSTKRGNS